MSGKLVRDRDNLTRDPNLGGVCAAPPLHMNAVSSPVTVLVF